MFCAKCGKTVGEGASFCDACGAALTSAPTQPAGWGPRARPSGLAMGLAVASILLALIGIPLLGLPAVAGLVVGIAALMQARRGDRGTPATAIAVAGVCLSALVIALAPTVVASRLKLWRKAQTQAEGTEDASSSHGLALPWGESDRKVECISNVKNIAIAAQMYLADWDAFWPSEHETKAMEYFNSAPGGGTPKAPPEVCAHATHANPYLREPVVLDDYIKSRDVWKCPSARAMSGARFIIPMGPGGDWVQHYKNHEGDWGKGHTDDSGGPCYPAFPPGWGGAVTDSLAQMQMADTYRHRGDAEWGQAFVTGYGMNSNCRDVYVSAIEDPALFVVVFESDLGCTATEGAKALVPEPRHEGGDNWGFADGHAKWISRGEKNPPIRWER